MLVPSRCSQRPLHGWPPCHLVSLVAAFPLPHEWGWIRVALPVRGWMSSCRPGCQTPLIGHLPGQSARLACFPPAMDAHDACPTILVVGGVGYKKGSGTRHAPPSLAESMPAARFDPANARSAVSGSQGGMMTSTLSQEAQPVSNPTHEATETPQQGTQDGTAANRAAVSVNTETAQASAAPAPLVNEEMRASMQAALDAKEREIAQLKKALADARRSAARATHAAKRARRTRAHVKPRQSSEVMLGFHIKQIIPGQGWVEDEETGRQIIVSVGDSISGAAVTKIDAERYEIQTTAGAIQF